MQQLHRPRVHAHNLTLGDAKRNRDGSADGDAGWHY